MGSNEDRKIYHGVLIKSNGPENGSTKLYLNDRSFLLATTIKFTASSSRLPIIEVSWVPTIRTVEPSPPLIVGGSDLYRLVIDATGCTVRISWNGVLLGSIEGISFEAGVGTSNRLIVMARPGKYEEVFSVFRGVDWVIVEATDVPLKSFCLHQD